jgi:hypothetical protein
MLVAGVGTAGYGTWSLLLAAAGLLGVLDFGVNAAVVRLVSAHLARGDEGAARAVYRAASTTMATGGALAGLSLLAVGWLRPDLVGLAPEPPAHAGLVLLVVAIDLAIGLRCSVFLGALSGLQQFARAHAIAIATVILRTAAFALVLLGGHGLLAVATVQLGANLAKYLAQHLLLRATAGFLRVPAAKESTGSMGPLLGYGGWAALGALAARVTTHTGALVAGTGLGARVPLHEVPRARLHCAEEVEAERILRRAEREEVVEVHEVRGGDELLGLGGVLGPQQVFGEGARAVRVRRQVDEPRLHAGVRLQRAHEPDRRAGEGSQRDVDDAH